MNVRIDVVAEISNGVRVVQANGHARAVGESQLDAGSGHTEVELECWGDWNARALSWWWRSNTCAFMRDSSTETVSTSSEGTCGRRRSVIFVEATLDTQFDWLANANVQDRGRRMTIVDVVEQA